MKHPATSSVESVTGSPASQQTSEHVSSRRRAVQAGEASDVAFFDFLDGWDAASEAAPTVNILQAIDDMESAADAQKAETSAEKKPKATPVSEKSPLASETPNSTRKPEAFSDARFDTEDMWSLDIQQLGWGDMKVLQHLGQAPPLPMIPLNNLSPSLLEQFPVAHYTRLNVSSELQVMLEKAYKFQRPVRIDLNESASIILRLGRDGRVSAEFLPNDQAAEMFFRQNMLDLKNRLESKQLPYGDLSVRHWKEPPEDRKRKQEHS